MTVWIIPGFAEGAWHTKELYDSLASAGYARSTSEETADILIAHSGGCYFLPPKHNAELIVLIGPPYWPGKPLPLCLVQKVWRDYRARAREGQRRLWYKKSLMHLWYLLGGIGLAVRMARSALNHDFYNALVGQKALIVRNQTDAWCSPELEQLAAKNPTFSFIALPGEHDDCWHHPERYVSLPQQYLKRASAP